MEIWDSDNNKADTSIGLVEWTINDVVRELETEVTKIDQPEKSQLEKNFQEIEEQELALAKKNQNSWMFDGWSDLKDHHNPDIKAKGQVQYRMSYIPKFRRPQNIDTTYSNVIQ